MALDPQKLELQILVKLHLTVRISTRKPLEEHPVCQAKWPSYFIKPFGSKRQVVLCEWKAGLVYLVSSRTTSST